MKTQRLLVKGNYSDEDIIDIAEISPEKLREIKSELL